MNVLHTTLSARLLHSSKKQMFKYQEHSQDAFNCHQHSFCCSEVLLDGILAAICTICHYLWKNK